MKTLTCIMTAAAWLVVSASALAAGALKNAGFTERGGTLPAAWQVAEADQNVWQVADDDGHSGADALRYRATESRKAGAVTQELVCKPNTEYVLVAWLKSNGTLKPLVRVTPPDARNVWLARPNQTVWPRHSARGIEKTPRLSRRSAADERHLEGNHR